MTIDEKLESLTEEQKKAYKQVELSFKVEGYDLTEEDKERIFMLATNQTDIDTEVNEILKKYKGDKK